MIEAHLPDGTVLQFPEGTSQAVIDRAVRQHLGVDQAAPTTEEPPRDIGWAEWAADQVIGLDNGYQTAGEDVGQWLNAAGESATLGVVGEEADAAVRGIWSDLPYEERLAQERAEEERFRQDNPLGALSADFAGAILPGLGWAGAAGRGANLLTRIGIGAGLGAGGGAVAGFAEGEGGAVNRVANALPSGVSPLEWGPAALGGLFGGAFPAVGAAAGAAYRGLGGGAARELRATERGLGLDRTASEFVADAAERDAPFAGQNLAEAGPRGLLAQMGPNTMALMDWVVNSPGAAMSRAAGTIENFTTERAQGFRGVLDEVLGDRMGVTARQTRLMDDTRAGRAGAYDAAYSVPIDYASEAGQRLEGLLGRIPPRVVSRIDELMSLEGLESQQRLFRQRDDGGFDIVRLPDVRELDLITRALNDMADPLGGAGPTARSRYEGLAAQIRDTMDEVVPEYGAARAAGGDAIANRNAIEFGARLLRSGANGALIPRDVAEATIARMGDAERTFAAQGIRDWAGEVMGNVQRLRRMGGNREELQQAIAPVQQMMTEDGTAKLIALLGPEEAERLLASAREVYSAVVLRNGTVRNSGTQPRSVLDQRLDQAIPMSPSEALQEGRGVSGAVMAGARPIAGDPSAGRMAARDDVMQAIAELLLSPASGAGARASLPALQQLPGLLAQVGQTSARISSGARGVGGVLGALMAQQQAR